MKKTVIIITEDKDSLQLSISRDGQEVEHQVKGDSRSFYQLMARGICDAVAKGFGLEVAAAAPAPTPAEPTPVGNA